MLRGVFAALWTLSDAPCAWLSFVVTAAGRGKTVAQGVRIPFVWSFAAFLSVRRQRRGLSD